MSQNMTKIEENWNEMMNWVDEKNEMYLQAFVCYHRKKQLDGIALSLVVEKLIEQHSKSKINFDLLVSLIDDMKIDYWKLRLRNCSQSWYPEKYPLFY